MDQEGYTRDEEEKSNYKFGHSFNWKIFIKNTENRLKNYNPAEISNFQ